MAGRNESLEEKTWRVPIEELMQDALIKDGNDINALEGELNEKLDYTVWISKQGK